MKRALALVAVATLTACTPAQIAGWVHWHEQDPDAAVSFAQQPDIVADLATGEHESDGPQFRQYLEASSRWDRIARCESGGRWDYPLVTNRTGTYSGGLMIWTRAWAAYGGHQYAPHAYLATKAEQIAVAERILADQGWGAWDCA